MSEDRLPTPGHALKYFEDKSMEPIEALALFFASWGQLGRVPTVNDYSMLYRALKEILPAVKEWPKQPVVYWSGEDANGTPKYQAVLTSYEKFKRYLEPFGPLFDAHEFIRAYEAGTAADYIASVEPARKQGGNNNPDGKNQHNKDEGQSANCDLTKPKRKPGKSNGDPERIIARLKRDANEGNTQAAALLGSLEAGDIKPYRAAVEMGWVKPPDPARIVEKQRERLEPAEQVRLWEQWGRALPEGAVDRVAVAVEAFDNLHGDEVAEFFRRIKSHGHQAA